MFLNVYRQHENAIAESFIIVMPEFKHCFEAGLLHILLDVNVETHDSARNSSVIHVHLVQLQPNSNVQIPLCSVDKKNSQPKITPELQNVFNKLYAISPNIAESIRRNVKDLNSIAANKTSYYHAISIAGQHKNDGKPFKWQGKAKFIFFEDLVKDLKCRCLETENRYNITATYPNGKVKIIIQLPPAVAKREKIKEVGNLAFNLLVKDAPNYSDDEIASDCEDVDSDCDSNCGCKMVTLALDFC